MSVCSTCGNPLMPGKYFCTRCGNLTLTDTPGGAAKDEDFVDAMDVKSEEVPRIKTGHWWDEAWGGGFVPTSQTLLGGAPGCGKALAIDTPIPVPSGWTTMGQIRRGDSVFDENGQACRVVSCSGVARGRPCYEICFSNGERIVADADHLWLTRTKYERTAAYKHTDKYRVKRRRQRRKRCGYKYTTDYFPELAVPQKKTVDPNGHVRTTKEIYDTLKQGAHTNHSIELTKPIVLPRVELPVPPYLLGVWLGDGSTDAGSYTSADPEIARKVRVSGYQVVEYHYSDGLASRWSVYGLITKLRKCGLLGNKHIPSVYLRASVSQRMDLLHGLMDTDGDCAKTGRCTFNSTSRVLVDSVCELLSSLGVKFGVSEGRAKLYGRDCGPAWRVGFTPLLKVFSLKRKRERQYGKRRPTQSRLYITSVQRVASVPVRCIRVDSPSRLFLAGRSMVPTHNSTLLIQIGFWMAKVTGKTTYFISAEQEKSEWKMYVDRLNLPIERGMFRVLKAVGAGGAIDETAFKAFPPCMIILDSVTALCGKDKDLQVVVADTYKKKYAAVYKAPTFLISHITKEGDLAGLMTLQHNVDGICSLFPNDRERSRFGGQPIFEFHKHRFGPCHKEFQLIMSEHGIVEAPKKEKMRQGGDALLAEIEEEERKEGKKPGKKEPLKAKVERFQDAVEASASVGASASEAKASNVVPLRRPIPKPAPLPPEPPAKPTAAERAAAIRAKKAREAAAAIKVKPRLRPSKVEVKPTVKAREKKGRDKKSTKKVKRKAGARA
jgi:hypothetical protein